MITPVTRDDELPPAESTPDRSHVGWQALCADLRDSLWMLVIIPTLLTGFLAAVSEGVRAQVGFTLLFCAAITVIATLVQSGLYTLVLTRLAPAEGLRALLLRALSVAAAVSVGGEVTLQACEALGVVADAAAERGKVLSVGAVVGAAVFTVSLALDRVHARRRAAERREATLKQQVLRAQLTALRARTNPHFLFNALNTVASLIEERPADAERAVEALSALFRYALDASARRLVTLDEELDAVASYLEVERLRFGDRLRVSVEVAAGCRARRVPPLVLQPLVENAVAHAVAQRRAGASVWITAQLSDDPAAGAGDALVLTVDDDGPGPGGSPRRAGSGTALRDLESRLQLSYPDGGAALLTGDSARGGFRAQVRVPADGTRASASALRGEAVSADVRAGEAALAGTGVSGA